MVSINIFSWSLLEPQSGEYSFDTLDRIMDLLGNNDIMADLATSTASPPPWMSRVFPEITCVTSDGKRMNHGSRCHFCPNSKDYRHKSAALVRNLARRYHAHRALAMWHVNNEYGPYCYCDNCAIAFRHWLRKRYQTLGTLNYAWSTSVWSQTYYNWEDIIPPRITPQQSNPSQELDYQHFMSDSILECFLNEKQVIREFTPNIPITTNFMVAYKPLDYFNWAPHVDIISVDIYPPHTAQAWETAITFDLMRSLKRGQPFIVMEQTPSQVNWMQQNPHKRPGNLRLQCHQAVAHGADGVLYFQFRQAKGGPEKFHSAIVSHEGTEHNRIFKQAAQIGAEMKKISSVVVGSKIKAEVAIILDWQNWWAVEYLPGPSDQLKYWEQIGVWYRALHGQNRIVDFVRPEDDLSPYRLVFAPVLYQIRPGVAENLERFVSTGGRLVTTFFSGIVDEHDQVILGGYPGPLRNLLGIWVEEFDPWTPEMSNIVRVGKELSGKDEGEDYPCHLWGELVHLEGATSYGVFKHDYYVNHAAITKNKFGKGEAWYVATKPNDKLVNEIVGHVAAGTGKDVIVDLPVGVEKTIRVNANGKDIIFLFNRTGEVAKVSLRRSSYKSLLTGETVKHELDVTPGDVAIILQS